MIAIVKTTNSSNGIACFSLLCGEAGASPLVLDCGNRVPSGLCDHQVRALVDFNRFHPSAMNKSSFGLRANVEKVALSAFKLFSDVLYGFVLGGSHFISFLVDVPNNTGPMDLVKQNVYAYVCIGVKQGRETPPQALFGPAFAAIWKRTKTP